MLLFVVGCQNSTLKHDVDEQQKIYINETTKNYGGLIELYKQRLQRADTEDTRHKLARAYYQTNDFQAVKRVLEPIIKKTKNDGILILYGHVESRLGHNDTALEYLNKAIEINSKNGEAYNVKGIVLLKKRQYDAARYAFNEARENFYDENKVTNNLAMLSILNKDYTEAYNQLNILYTKGYRDSTILHNLLFTLVKLDRMQLAKSFCLTHKLSNEPDILVQELKRIEPIDAIKFNEIKPSQSDIQKQYTTEKTTGQLAFNNSETEVAIKSKNQNKSANSTKSLTPAKSGSNVKLSNMTKLDPADSSTNVASTSQKQTDKTAITQSTILAVRSGEHGKFSRITFETEAKLSKKNYLIEKISPTEFKLSFYDVTLPAEGIDKIIKRISSSERDFATVKGTLTAEKTLILEIKTKQNSIVKDFYAGPNSKGKAHCFAFDFYLEKK
ncbi:Flp pilus assembly protein TadD, contains TPR repeat [Gilliamella apicola]|nr:tetratricopeptide repeat protein [Gilliamella apicola]AHN25296.1 Flp pilus assembly protein TadD, contains TPR repeat [Gilliamella apicola]